MAATLVVPVIIHLWNVREGKTLKIGSIQLLQQTAQPHASSLRLRDWLLLLLRCLLILLLTLLLAGPYWPSHTKPAQQAGWIVLDPQNRKELYTLFKPRIDSLLGKGLELHDFSGAFPAFQKETLLSPDSSGTADSTSYWIRLERLYKQAPAGMPVYLYTNNELKNFTGKRPASASNLHWQAATLRDSVSSWLAAAYLSAPDSIRIIKAVSTPGSTVYTTENLSATKASPHGYATSFENGRFTLTSSTGLHREPVEVDTSTMQVVVFTDKYPHDARYVEAAIQAIRQYSGHRIQVKLIHDPQSRLPPPDWLFWLSDKPVPYIANSRIFRYVAGREQKRSSWIMQEGIESKGEPIALYKTVSDSSADADNEPVWLDGYGDPVLTKTNTPKTTFYNFYSRFDPQWTDLPWSSRFPVWLLQLLLEEQAAKENGKWDKRSLSQEQLTAAGSPVRQSGIAKSSLQKKEWEKPIWIAALLLFFLERAISYSRKKDQYDRTR
ncbi:MAG: BatA domain-containing protein [Williamsia sp.]|nr:BatA domain-containing protein [Williamsia sp.]